MVLKSKYGVCTVAVSTIISAHISWQEFLILDRFVLSQVQNCNFYLNINLDSKQDKIKNFLRARRGSGCAKISLAMQCKVDGALFMKYAKRCRLRAILAPLRGLFFSSGLLAISTSLRGPDSFQAVIASMAAISNVNGRVPRMRERTRIRFGTAPSPRQVKSALLFRKKFVRARHLRPGAERNRTVRAYSNCHRMLD